MSYRLLVCSYFMMDQDIELYGEFSLPRQVTTEI